MNVKVRITVAYIGVPWCARFAAWYFAFNGHDIGPFQTQDEAEKAAANLASALRGV